MYFKKCDVITFTCCLAIAQPKNKYIALTFCMSVACMYMYVYVLYVCMCLDHIFSVFGYLESIGFYRQLFLKIEIMNFWTKIDKYQKSEIAIL